jgi:hypothetical protein
VPATSPVRSRIVEKSAFHNRWLAPRVLEGGVNRRMTKVAGTGLRPIAVITKEAIVSKILSHLNVPRNALVADEPSVAYYDMTREPVPSWVLGVDPDPEADARAPPASYTRLSLVVGGGEAISPPDDKRRLP